MPLLELPDWLAEAIRCPSCGRPCIRTPSGYMGCRMGGHMPLILQEHANDKIKNAWMVAYRAGRTNRREPDGFVRLAWRFMRQEYRTAVGICPRCSRTPPQTQPELFQ